MPTLPSTALGTAVLTVHSPVPCPLPDHTDQTTLKTEHGQSDGPYSFLTMFPTSKDSYSDRKNSYRIYLYHTQRNKETKKVNEKKGRGRDILITLSLDFIHSLRNRQLTLEHVRVRGADPLCN